MAYNYETWANQAKNYYDQAGAAALPSAASRDTAAARVRSRLQGAQSGIEQQLGDEYAGRGVGNSGLYREALGKSRQSYMGNLATGLADVESDFNNRQQAGAQILQGIGSGYRDMASDQLTAANNAAQVSVARQQADNAARANEIELRRNDAAAKAQTQSNIAELLRTFGQYGNTALNQNQMALMNRFAPMLSTLYPGLNFGRPY